jgi:hypothetical protein
MSKYAKYVDLGEEKPVLSFSARGVLLPAAIEAYENGNPKAELIVDRTLALAARRGYGQCAEFRAEFQQMPADIPARQRQVDAVFQVIDSWEFMHRVMAPCLAAMQCEGQAPNEPRSAPRESRSLH